MNRPNMVLVVLDTCRYDYWMEIIARGIFKEPNKFIIFHNAFSTATWTPPSIASIFTGKYPHQHGILAEGDTVPPLKEPGLAYELKRLGYYTYALTSNPVVTFFVGEGFLKIIEINVGKRELIHGGVCESVHGGVHIPMSMPIKYLSSDYEPSNRFARLIRKVIKFSYYFTKDVITLGRKYYGSPVVNQTITELLGKRLLKEPFFLFINYMDAHDYLYHTSILNRWRINITKRKDLRYRVYRGAVERLANTLNELLCIFKEWGLLDRTIIIITSDHGELLGEYGLVGHAHVYPYDELIRVPLMIYDPYETGRGEITKIFSIRDIYGFILKRITHEKSIIEYVNELPDYVIIEDKSLGNEFFKHYRCVIKPPVKLILDVASGSLDVKLVRLEGYSIADTEESLRDATKILRRVSIEAEVYKRLRALRKKIQV